jgi:hypothetical protein
VSPGPRSRTKPGARPKPAAPAKPRARAQAPIAGYSGKPTIDKLGIKPGMKVAVLGLDSERAFLAELKARAGVVTSGRTPAGADVVLMRADSERELAKLTTLERTIARNGMIWVVWPKGQPHIKEDHVRAAALRQGLVDVKVCAFSETLSALKLVIPVARR